MSTGVKGKAVRDQATPVTLVVQILRSAVTRAAPTCVDLPSIEQLRTEPWRRECRRVGEPEVADRLDGVQAAVGASGPVIKKRPGAPTPGLV